MAHIIKFEGVEEIKMAMKETFLQLGISQERGLKRGGLYIQRKSQQVVPILTGTLKNSAGTRVLGSGWYADVVVFYTASYAVYVHERTDLQHAPDKQAKFLEGPARKHRYKMLLIISGEMARHMKHVRSFKGKK